MHLTLPSPGAIIGARAIAEVAALKKLPPWLSLLFLLAVVYLALQLGSRGPASQPSLEIPYSQFKSLTADGKVAEVILEDHAVQGTLVDPEVLKKGRPPVQLFETRIPEDGDAELLPSLERTGVVVHVRKEREGSGRTLLYLLPWVLIIGFWIWMWRRVMGNLPGGVGQAGPLGKFLQSGATKRVQEIPDVRFEDVAGQESAKREVAELIDFLMAAEKYRRLGAEVPHGILLMGPPGTGKTLLARALAGEAQVPFFSISASEFIELFVGVGAARVRNLFEEAKKSAPSIVFIDEIDSVGRVRGAGLGGGHDEREQTLNQILAELDGFTGHEAVVVLAATNRPDVLDPALLRPGRFDRHVTLDLPDRKARLEILRVHTRDVALADGVDLDVVAASTPGFSGADLKNLVNEAAMLAARDGDAQVRLRHFDAMRDRVTIGTERSIAMTPDEHHRLAVHEAGHTAVAYYLPHTDPLYKVSIIPRGSSLGATQQLPDIERHTLPEEYLRDRLAVTLAGRAAEKELLGSVSSGADDDIRQATRLARAMVARWGMSEDVGPMDVRESDEHPFLGREIAQPRVISETTARAVDEAVRQLLTAAEETASETIRRNRPSFETLVAALEGRETLDQAAIEACLGPGALLLSPERAEG